MSSNSTVTTSMKQCTTLTELLWFVSTWTVRLISKICLERESREMFSGSRMNLKKWLSLSSQPSVIYSLWEFVIEIWNQLICFCVRLMGKLKLLTLESRRITLRMRMMEVWELWLLLEELLSILVLFCGRLMLRMVVILDMLLITYISLMCFQLD